MHIFLESPRASVELLCYNWDQSGLEYGCSLATARIDPRGDHHENRNLRGRVGDRLTLSVNTLRRGDRRKIPESVL